MPQYRRYNQQGAAQSAPITRPTPMGGPGGSSAYGTQVSIGNRGPGMGFAPGPGGSGYGTNPAANPPMVGNRGPGMGYASAPQSTANLAATGSSPAIQQRTPGTPGNSSLMAQGNLDKMNLYKGILEGQANTQYGLGNEAGYQNAQYQLSQLNNEIDRFQNRPPPGMQNIVDPGTINAPWGSMQGIDINGQQVVLPPAGGGGATGAYGGGVPTPFGGSGGGTAGGGGGGGAVPISNVPGGNSAVLSAAYQQAHDEARKANEERYAEILAGYGELGSSLASGFQDRYDRNMGYLEGYGDQQLSDTNRRYDDQAQTNAQELVNRGLTNSTVANSVNQVNERERGDALNRVNEQIARLNLQTDSQLSADALNVPSQVDMRRLQFQEDRTDAYPDMSQLLALQQSLGAGGNVGYGGGAATSGIPSLLNNDGGGGGDSASRRDAAHARRVAEHQQRQANARNQGPIMQNAGSASDISGGADGSKGGGRRMNSAGNLLDWELPPGGYLAGVPDPGYQVPEWAYGMVPGLSMPQPPARQGGGEQKPAKPKKPNKGGGRKVPLPTPEQLAQLGAQAAGGIVPGPLGALLSLYGQTTQQR